MLTSPPHVADSVRAKILVIGPAKSGKTRVANFLSKHEEAVASFEVYKPTKGARILEFEENIQAGKRGAVINVELWDCSGDRQFESCWPAILREAQAVVMVYDPTSKEQEKDIEQWYKAYTARLGLTDAQVCAIWSHD